MGGVHVRRRRIGVLREGLDHADDGLQAQIELSQQGLLKIVLKRVKPAVVVG